MCVLCKLECVYARVFERKLVDCDNNFWKTIIFILDTFIADFFWIQFLLTGDFTLCTWYGFDSVPIFGWNNKSGSLSFLNLPYFFSLFQRKNINLFEWAEQEPKKNAKVHVFILFWTMIIFVRMNNVCMLDVRYFPLKMYYYYYHYWCVLHILAKNTKGFFWLFAVKAFFSAIIWTFIFIYIFSFKFPNQTNPPFCYSPFFQ